PTIFSDKETKEFATYFKNNYVLFGDSVSTEAQKNSAAYFENDKFYTQVQTQSQAKINASIFNAAGEGFSFVASSVTEVKSPISSLQLIIAMSILILLILLLFTFMLIMYRLLALFTIIVSVTSISVTAAIMTAFKISFGLEAVLGAIILLTLAFDISSLLFSLIRHNLYNKKRGVRSSFNISAKEVAVYGIDMLIAIIISSISLF